MKWLSKCVNYLTHRRTLNIWPIFYTTEFQPGWWVHSWQNHGNKDFAATMYSPPPKFTTNIVVSTFTTNIVVSVAWNVAMACKQMIKHNKYRSCVSFLRQRGLLAHLILPHLLHGALPWHAHSNRKPLTTKIAAACLFACTPDWYCRICCMERSRGVHTGSH